MTLSFTDLKKGTIFQMDSAVYKVLEYSHIMKGRGSSSVSVKIRSLSDGKILDKTFKGSDNIEPAAVETRPVQYLYSDDNRHHFMDSQNYDQLDIDVMQLEDVGDYLKEGESYSGQFFNSQLINIELPKNVPLQVTYTEDAVKGDTSTAVSKNATLETGLVIKVPAFIKQDDMISVDTSTGAYRERVKR